MRGLIHVTEEQQELVKMIRDFMRKEIAPHVLEFDEAAGYPPELIKAGIDMGLNMMQVPEEYGGMGLSTTTTAMLLEEGSMVESTYMGTFNVANMGAKIVMFSGTEDQKHKFIDYLINGGLSAFCLTEPDVGSDAASVKTNVVRKGDKYILNGSKAFITNAGIADVFLVVATMDPGSGRDGLATFMVDSHLPGITVGKKENKLGMRLSNICAITFEDVELPLDSLIGEKGQGFANAMKVLEMSRPLVAASNVGGCRKATNMAIKYAQERIQFGKPIYKFEAVQMMLADMEMITEAARALTYNACALIDAGLPCSKESSMCKCYASDAYQKVTSDAVQIFGGYGTMKEYMIEKLYRDAKITQIVEGSNQIQRIVVAKQMIKEHLLV